jgi:hypothetical protein
MLSGDEVYPINEEFDCGGRRIAMGRPFCMCIDNGDGSK